MLSLGASARARGLLGQFALLRNDGAVTEQRLREAWDGHDPGTEPLVGAAAAVSMTLHCLGAGTAADARIWADRARASAGTVSPPLAGLGLVLGGMALALLGRGRDGGKRLAVLPARAADLLQPLRLDLRIPNRLATSGQASPKQLSVVDLTER